MRTHQLQTAVFTPVCALPPTSTVGCTPQSYASKWGYTLVELIVVIAILVILSTVGFVGYSQYSITSRDGARASDIKGIYEWLKIVQAQKGKAPNPDDALTIRNGSGTIHTLQGTVGESVRQTVGLESGWRDPQSAKPYTYSLYSDKKHFQLLAMFEQDGFQDKFAWDSPIAPSAYAESADLTPVTIGSEIWVVLDTATETPINEVLTGSTSLIDLAASGATIVGSSVGTGSSVVITNSNISALSNPFANGGAVANSTPTVPLEEQLFGASSIYTTGWTSNTCDPNAITVVEVNPGNYATLLPNGSIWAPVNTIYKFAAGTYTMPLNTGWLGLSVCSGIVGSGRWQTIFQLVDGGGLWTNASSFGVYDGDPATHASHKAIFAHATFRNDATYGWHSSHFIRAGENDLTFYDLDFTRAAPLSTLPIKQFEWTAYQQNTPSNATFTDIYLEGSPYAVPPLVY